MPNSHVAVAVTGVSGRDFALLERTTTRRHSKPKGIQVTERESEFAVEDNRAPVPQPTLTQTLAYIDNTSHFFLI